MSEEWNTRQSLLLRAKDPSDGEAWTDFVKYYERFIFYLLHRMNINPDDLNDLAQVILVKLWKSLKNYEPQAKFRTWLAQVVRYAVYDYYQAEKRRNHVIPNNLLVEQSTQSAGRSNLEEMVEKEWKLYMTRFALDRLRHLFSKTALEVFELTLDGQSAHEIAEQLNIGVDSVYTFRSRVKARFIKELKAVMREVESDETGM